VGRIEGSVALRKKDDDGIVGIGCAKLRKRCSKSNEETMAGNERRKTRAFRESEEWIESESSNQRREQRREQRESVSSTFLLF